MNVNTSIHVNINVNINIEVTVNINVSINIEVTNVPSCVNIIQINLGTINRAITTFLPYAIITPL